VIYEAISTMLVELNLLLLRTYWISDVSAENLTLSS